MAIMIAQAMLIEIIQAIIIADTYRPYSPNSPGHLPYIISPVMGPLLEAEHKNEEVN